MLIVFAIASVLLAATSADRRWVSAGYRFADDMIGSFPKGLQLDTEDGASSKILEGYTAKQNEYPFVVYLMNGNGIECTGTLVDRRWVLTSAKCADSAITHAVLGDYDRKKDDGTEQIIEVDKVILHPNAANQVNDTALLRLASRADITSEAVSLIALVDSAGFMRKVLANEKMCLQLGWGYTQRGNNKWVLPRRLRAIQVQHVNETEMERRGYSSMVETGHLGTEAIYEDDCEFGSTCFGDEGGPVICKKGKGWVQTGIFSYFFTPDGCMTGVKAIENVLKYYDWIQSYIS